MATTAKTAATAKATDLGAWIDDDEDAAPFVDNPAAAALNLEQNTSPVRTVKIRASFRVWLEREKLRCPSRKSWAPVIKAVRDFTRTNRLKTFRGLRVEQIDKFIEAKLAKRDYSRGQVHFEVRVVQRFFRWACRRHRLTNPYANFDWEDCAYAGHTDRTRPRRAMSFEEWEWVQRVTLEAKTIRKRIPAEIRVLLYRTVLQTGFRAAECSRLRVMDLHVGAPDVEGVKNPDPSYLELPGRPVRGKNRDRRTKNLKPCRQYLQYQLAVDLQTMVRRREDGWHSLLRKPGNPLFHINKTTFARVAERLVKPDLDHARVEYLVAMEKQSLPADPNFLSYQDDNGEVLDFHSLRHTCGAWLAYFTNNVQTVMKVMRHSNSDMTTRVYGHIFRDQTVEAVMKLPNV